MRGGHFWNGGRFARRYRRELVFPFITLLSTTSAHAFRTAQDSVALANEGRIAWEGGAPAFSLQRDNLPDGVNESQFEEALEASLEVWSAVECTTVHPSALGWTDDSAEPADGRNTIQWVSTWSELDRKSTRLNSSHSQISYAVFCLKKKTQ